MILSIAFLIFSLADQVLEISWFSLLFKQLHIHYFYSVCIWVSIFYVLCCSSSLLSVHTLRLPAEVWRQDEVELGRVLCARSCALVHLKSKMLLSEPCRKELSRLKRWVWPLPLPDPFLDVMLPAVPWRGPCLPGIAGCGSSQNGLRCQ